MSDTVPEVGDEALYWDGEDFVETDITAVHEQPGPGLWEVETELGETITVKYDRNEEIWSDVEGDIFGDDEDEEDEDE